MLIKLISKKSVFIKMLLSFLWLWAALEHVCEGEMTTDSSPSLKIAQSLVMGFSELFGIVIKELNVLHSSLCVSSDFPS